jgi:hypothetical protein
LNCTGIGVGDTLTETAAATVIVAGIDLLVSETEVAVSATLLGLG